MMREFSGTHHTLRRGARTVSWWQFGQVTPVTAELTVLYCHGTPGSGLEAHRLALSDPTVSVIAIDRPGYSRTTRMTGRQAHEWVDDAQAVLQHTGVKRLGVLGYSGGGPHALTLVAALPARISALSLVAPVAEHTGLTGMMEKLVGVVRARLLWAGTRVLPTAIERLARVPRVQTRLHALREALQAGFGGAVDDELAIISNWGISLTRLSYQLRDHEIAATVWVAGKDRVVDPDDGRRLAADLGARLEVLSECGHANIISEARIVSSLIADMRGRSA